MLRIDKQECSSISNNTLDNVAKLNRLKKKFSLILIASKILSLLSIYRLLQYELKKLILYVSTSTLIFFTQFNASFLEHSKLLELLEKF